MHTVSLSALALLAGSAAARICTNVTVPITITARNAVFNNTMTPLTNLDAHAFALNSTRQGENFTNIALTGYANVAGSYNISAMYCKPNNGSSKTLQILTHGIGFDKTYWDLSYHNYNNSYVADAVDKFGYSTISYDRLGIGNSSHGDPKNEIQSFLEVEALAALTRKARNGTFPQVNATFDKIVHVGHSFGSAQTYALVAKYPTISDGIVLTGFSTNASFVNYFTIGNDFQQAALNSPIRFGPPAVSAYLQEDINAEFVDFFSPVDLATPAPATVSYNYSRGYLTNNGVGAQLFLFFYPGHFDTGLLYVAERTKQPVTIGEALTLGSIPATNGFKGPVFVIDGSNDLPYCGGDCVNTGGVAASLAAMVSTSFPSASSFSSYIQPNTGHGINLHYNATAAYDVIQNWIGGHVATA